MRSGVCAVFAVLLAWAAPARADHLDQSSYEERLVLFYHVPEERLAALLPAGWAPMDLPGGPGKGANLTVNLSDQLTAAGADGKPAADARAQGITISARVRDPKTGDNRSMVLLGYTNGSDAPGPYGTHHQANIAMTRRAHTMPSGNVAIDELWEVSTLDGDRLYVELGYIRGPASAAHTEQQTRSSLHPDFYRIYKMDQLSDPVRSAALNVDRTSRVEVTTGGRLAKLVTPSDTLVAIVSVPTYHREIWLPD